MAMISWPFDSTVTLDEYNHPVFSRAYSADVLAKILQKYFRNGIFSDASDNLQVLEESGMTVAVQPGSGLINGRHCYEDSTRVLTVQAADATYDRIDTVVLRLDLAPATLSIDLYVVQGTAAATPSAPALTRNATVYELGLANLFIVKSSTSIPQSRITDTRLDTSRCGIVASIIGDTDTTEYYAQIAADLAEFKADREADFDAWFASITGILGTEAAGNLLNLINQYRAKSASVTLAVVDWTLSGSFYTQTKAVGIVGANCILHAGPDESSRDEYIANDVHVSAASEGSVTFKASGLPSSALTVELATAEVDA